MGQGADAPSVLDVAMAPDPLEACAAPALQQAPQAMPDESPTGEQTTVQSPVKASGEAPNPDADQRTDAKRRGPRSAVRAIRAFCPACSGRWLISVTLTMSLPCLGRSKVIFVNASEGTGS